MTGTLGLLLGVLVTAANRDDGAVAPDVLSALHAGEFPRLSVLWADTKYRNNDLDGRLAAPSRLRVEVTTKPGGQEGLPPLAKRRVVEQTFGCLVRSRRVVRDCERLAETSAAMVRARCVHRMARRDRPPRGERTFRYERMPAA